MRGAVARELAEAPGPIPSDDVAAGLAELLHGSLDLAEIVISDVLEPGLDDPAPTDAASAEDIGKTVGELAMLLRAAFRAFDDEPSRQRVVALARRLTPFAQSADVRWALVVKPSQATMRSLAHCCLRDIGVDDEATSALVRAAFTASAAGATERVPYRLLDSAWVRHFVLGDAELDHPAVFLSPIGQGVDLVTGSVEAAYAFSHALPYATDFGRVPLPEGTDAERLSAIADVLIAQALFDDDLDLLGELLMTPALLHGAWSPTQVFGWRVLERVWRRYGFVPGPGLPPATHGEDRSATVQRVLGTVYHTTLVAGLLVATLMTSDSPPPGRLPQAMTGTSLGLHPPPRSLGITPERIWRELWDESTPADRAQLDDLVLALRLHDALQGGDLTDVLGLVRRAVTAGRADHPLVEQSAELLKRARLAHLAAG